MQLKIVQMTDQMKISAFVMRVWIQIYAKQGKNSKYLNICSSVYYMTKNGYCLKYTDHVQIYNVFNITDDFPKYRTKRNK